MGVLLCHASNDEPHGCVPGAVNLVDILESVVGEDRAGFVGRPGVSTGPNRSKVGEVTGDRSVRPAVGSKRYPPPGAKRTVARIDGLEDDACGQERTGKPREVERIDVGKFLNGLLT